MSKIQIQPGQPQDYGRSVKSHKLAKAYYTLNKSEKRVMEAAISLLVSGNRKVVITADYYSTVYGVDASYSYKTLQAAGSGLVRKILRIKNDDESIKEVTLLSSQEYFKKNGALVLEFNESILPLLQSLKEDDRTFLHLKETANFTSIYTLRLYDVAKSWCDQCVKTFPVEIDEVKAQLSIPQSYNYAQVKSVIYAGMQQINAFTSVFLSFEEEKRAGGKRVTHLLFTVEKRKSKVELGDIIEGEIVEAVEKKPRATVQKKPIEPQDLKNGYLSKGFTDEMFDNLVSHRLSLKHQDSQQSINSVIKELIKASGLTSLPIKDVLHKYYASGWKRFEAEWFMSKNPASNQSSIDFSKTSDPVVSSPAPRPPEKPSLPKKAEPPPPPNQEDEYPLPEGIRSPKDLLKTFNRM
ncbi:replication initiation protein [Thiomicrorhabdus aquaedulcis]|uniref:replication initiation protein n=1 Tax=Thiomicrorhabdus aquaedulcis TaxID=2211106 RepID=UPI000FD70684|nr:replication initiation protein [Thiomicrorhabdus aquaedulcis]